MFPISTFIAVLSILKAAEATVHHLFVGTFGAASLYTVAFDDEALTLELVKNSTASTGHSWIAFDVRTKPIHQESQRT
jgi:carboxy-cis,cis-muconate cyclase